jgi:hypothetical protein
MMHRTLIAYALPLCLIAAAARAQPAGPQPLYGTYAGCLERLAARPEYAPLAEAGFFADKAPAGAAFITPAQAALVPRYQADAATCQVALRTALENIDARLADLAAQTRQLSDVNELLLFDRAEDWAAYSVNRRRIEAGLWRAAQAETPAAPMEAGAPDAGLN